MTKFEYVILGSQLNPFVVPLYMEPTSNQVFLSCNREQSARPSPDDVCRSGLDLDHACWPAPPAPSWWWQVWSDPHPLETGVEAVLSGRDSFD